MTIKVCLAGATGWAGSELARGIASADDLTLVAGVSRTHAGRQLGEVLGDPKLKCPLFATAAQALAVQCDVFVEYTNPEVAKTNVIEALNHGAYVVVGTSGLTVNEFSEIDVLASDLELGVLACGNFSISAVLLQRFSEIAARHIDQWEIIDFAHDDKIDAPSGTARELADRLANVRNPRVPIPLEQTVGERDTRGATLSGTQVHSVRLPGYVISTEIIFGTGDHRLSIRHDSGNSAQPYVEGAMVAIRKVSTLKGLHRGLDSVLEL